MRLSALLLITPLIGLLVLAIVGILPSRTSEIANIKPQYFSGPANTPLTLYVLVHGYNPTAARWDEMAVTLKTHGAVLLLNYEAGPFANTDPMEMSQKINEQIDKTVSEKNIRRVVLVAHSMGAQLTRRALLLGYDGNEFGPLWCPALCFSQV